MAQFLTVGQLQRILEECPDKELIVAIPGTGMLEGAPMLAKNAAIQTWLQDTENKRMLRDPEDYDAPFPFPSIHVLNIE